MHFFPRLKFGEDSTRCVRGSWSGTNSIFLWRAPHFLITSKAAGLSPFRTSSVVDLSLATERQETDANDKDLSAVFAEITRLCRGLTMEDGFAEAKERKRGANKLLRKVSQESAEISKDSKESG